MKVKKKTNVVRSLVTIGIMNAVMLVLFGIGGMVASFFPPLFIVLPVIMGLICGITFMFMVAKANVSGIFVISGAILGICMITMAPYGSMAICIFLGGVLGEIVFQLMGNDRFISAATGYVCYILGFALGVVFPFAAFGDAYIAQEAAKESSTLDVVERCVTLVTPVTVIVICFLSMITAYIGSLWGKKILNKHFKKAGLV